jgi:hypothetical protein
MAAQQKRMAKERLDASENSVLEESERSVQNWADNQRSALARRQDNESGTMAQRHELEQEDLESNINTRKVIRNASY